MGRIAIVQREFEVEVSEGAVSARGRGNSRGNRGGTPLDTGNMADAGRDGQCEIARLILAFMMDQLRLGLRKFINELVKSKTASSTVPPCYIANETTMGSDRSS